MTIPTRDNAKNNMPTQPTFPGRIAFAEARDIVSSVAQEAFPGSERIAIARAHGRILAQDVVAPIALPSFDNSAMDGFAVRHADLADEGDTTLQVVAEQFAGRALDVSVSAGQCIRITTGAPLPPGSDTVVVKEDATVLTSGAITQGAADATGLAVRIGTHMRRGAHVRYAGEDVGIGDLVLRRGIRLTPTRIALAAALGIDQLDVAPRPTIAVFTTGDELVEPGLPLKPGQIYNSNRELLLGLLREDGLEPTAWPTLPDDPARVSAMLRDAASSFDIVVTCGAVSAGEKDHIPALLQQAAADGSGAVHFWKVRMKPGMPVLFGHLGGAQFLGLPGNPVSVLATWLTLGRCLIDGLQGRTEHRPRWHARLSADFDKRNSRREFLRGRLLPGSNGTLEVEPNPADGSHRLAAAAQSNVLIVLPEGERRFTTGDVVEVLDWQRGG